MKKVYFWELLDWRTIRSSFLIFLVIGVGYGLSKLKDHIDEKQSEALSGFAVGEFQFIKGIESMYQSRFRGSVISVEYYEVNYSFKVNGAVYLGTENIYTNSSNNDFLNRLLRGEKKDLRIRYNPSNPEQSAIMFY